MNNTSRLGKGLASLLGERKIFVNTTKNLEFDNELDIDLIYPNPKQPRKEFNKEELDDLAQSIKNFGLLQPIIVRPSTNQSGKYEIIAGERRYRACKILGFKKIQAIVKNLDNENSFNLSIIENIQRSNLNTIEEAIAYKNLIDLYNFTQTQLAEKIGKSRSYIANILRVLNLPDKVLDYLNKGLLDYGHIRPLIGNPRAEELAQYILENNLSVRQVEKLVKTKKVIKKNKHSISQEIHDVLKDKLKNFSFKITNNSENDGGQLVIKYNNTKELNLLLDKIN